MPQDRLRPPHILLRRHVLEEAACVKRARARKAKDGKMETRRTRLKQDRARAPARERTETTETSDRRIHFAINNKTEQKHICHFFAAFCAAPPKDFQCAAANPLSSRHRDWGLGNSNDVIALGGAVPRDQTTATSGVGGWKRGRRESRGSLLTMNRGGKAIMAVMLALFAALCVMLAPLGSHAAAEEAVLTINGKAEWDAAVAAHPFLVAEF